jgi:hypothetical protein
VTNVRPLPMALPDARSRRAAAMIVLLLRLALGLSTLNAGLVGYLSQKLAVQGGAPGRWANPRNPYFAMNMYSGGGGGTIAMDAGHQFLAAGQIGLGVAVLLGFSTPMTAAAIGFLTILPSAIVCLVLIGSGITSDYGGSPNPVMFGPMMDFAVFGSSNVPTLLHVALVVWLSSLGIMPFSLDALILARRGNAQKRRNAGSSGFPDPVPESAKGAGISVSYAPETSLKEIGAPETSP